MTLSLRIWTPILFRNLYIDSKFTDLNSYIVQKPVYWLSVYGSELLYCSGICILTLSLRIWTPILFRNLYIDSKFTDLNSYIVNNGTLTGCPERREFCMSHPCQNKGQVKQFYFWKVCPKMLQKSVNWIVCLKMLQKSVNWIVCLKMLQKSVNWIVCPKMLQKSVNWKVCPKMLQKSVNCSLHKNLTYLCMRIIILFDFAICPIF